MPSKAISCIIYEKDSVFRLSLFDMYYSFKKKQLGLAPFHL